MRLRSKALGVLLGGTLIGCARSTPVTPPLAPGLSWTSNGNPGAVSCSATKTTGCLTTYTITDATTGTVVASNIPATALSYTVSTLPSAGVHTYQLTINGVDTTGRSVASPPATTTVDVTN